MREARDADGVRVNGDKVTLCVMLLVTLGVNEEDTDFVNG